MKSQLTTTELTSSSKLKPSSISPSFNVAFLLAKKKTEELTEEEVFSRPLLEVCYFLNKASTYKG